MTLWLWMGLATASLAAPPSTLPPGAVVATTDRHPLDRSAFRFCHEPGAQASEVQAWCDLVDEVPEERCPGLHRTCAGADTTRSSGCSPDPQRPEDVAYDVRPPELEELEPSEGCGGGCGKFSRSYPNPRLQWVGALAVALVVGILLRLLVQGLGRVQPRQQAPTIHAVDVVDEIDVPDVPSAELLARARSAFQAGDAVAAVRLARSAALRRLAEARKLVLHRSRTDREYVRTVRSNHRELGEALAEIVGTVEAHRFGGRTLDLERAREVLRAAERILLGALVLLTVLLPRASHAQNMHAPHGNAALGDLFELHGYEPRWLEGELSDVTGRPDVVVLDLTRRRVDWRDWNWLRSFVRKGGLLIVTGPAHLGFPALGGLSQLSPRSPVVAGDDLPEGLPVPAVPGGFTHIWIGIDGEVWVEALGTGQRVGVPGTRSLWEGERAPTVMVLEEGNGAVLAISDARLLTNGALIHPDNERFLAEAPLFLASRPPIDVLLVVRPKMTTAPEPDRRPVANPRLLPFVLQLGLTWGLVMLWKGWPFGVPRDPSTDGRTRFVEHVDALASRWQQVRATRWALRASAQLWLHRLGPRGLELAARRAGYSADAAKRFVDDIEAVARGDGEGRDPSDLEKVEELWRITNRT